MEKRRETAIEEAKHALEEYELSLNQTAAKGLKDRTPSGRRVFGTTTSKVEEANIKHRPDIHNFGSDDDDIVEEKNDTHMESWQGNKEKDIDIDLDVLREGLDIGNNSAIEVFGFFSFRFTFSGGYRHYFSA